MNENFTNISYVDEEDEAVNDIDGVETASLDAQVAQLTTKQPDSDLLAAIAQDLDVREKTGSAISDGLAGILTSLLKEKLADEKIQSKIDKYPRPSNVEGLRTPRVNHLIWNQLPAQDRTQDSKMKKSQNALVASLVAMSRATELVLKESKGNKELVTCMTDAIALAIQGCHDMNNTRRQAMKKELNKDYTALCNSSTVDASSEFLFGDLSKLAKDITDANKLTKKVRPSHQQGNFSRNNRYTAGGRRNFGTQSHRFSPYQRGRNDFLSKGYPPKSRMKKEGAAKQN
ncbi:uncharacterized protein LOC114949617 [Acropora millepora]|uniref:uncharacterized protein LOC114949617 n=1 Tax=Acropora millepora TaxID=45264 RepID=UPI001CF43922|nr:uncharacterized protein LOC114949617 [Acropora millepora]